jgi:hypothetical protein
MIARMAGKTPLLLASFLFGVGVTGLVISTAERAEWGPFQPRTRTPEPRVVAVQVGPEITPPPLLELMNGIPDSALGVDTSAQVQAPPPTAPPPPEPTPTPVPPLRVYGIASDDAGVSAAGTSPTPPPPLRAINIASDAEPETTPEDAASPGGTAEDQAEPQPQTGCTDCEDVDGVSDEDSGAAPILAAGKSGHAIPGNANGLLRRVEAVGAVAVADEPGNRGRSSR